MIRGTSESSLPADRSDTIRRLVRPNILDLAPYQSARDKVREGVLLDANESPHASQWEGVSLNRYPDPGQLRLRESLAGYLGVEIAQVVAGVGSDEILDWILKVFCQPGEDGIATVEPTYGMYRVMADIHGIRCFSLPLDSDFNFSADRFLREVPAMAKVAFLCSPNNPTGNRLDRREILRLCREWPRVVVLDEAYVEFADEPSLVGDLAGHCNLILLRTLSKAFGKAGLRLGYAVADPFIVSQFLKVKAPYNLSGPAIETGCRTIGRARQELSWVEEARAERERLSEGLRAMSGVEEVFPSQANFLLFRCPPGPSICRALGDRGIIVRDRSSLVGLEDCIRVSVGTAAENELFLDQLESVLEERI